MTETLHIRLEVGEAINSKRNLLSSEINFINILKKIQNYRDLRRKELARKIELKSIMRETSELMKKFKEEMPKSKVPEAEENEPAAGLLETTKKLKLEDELKEIKDRLARLG